MSLPENPKLDAADVFSKSQFVWTMYQQIASFESASPGADRINPSTLELAPLGHC
jgi:hypothetical protein